MTYVLDIVFLVILLVSIANGLAEGFVKQIVSTIGTILAVVLAALLRNPVATWIYDKMFSSKVYEYTADIISSCGNAVSDVQAALTDKLPNMFAKAIEQLVTQEQLQGVLVGTNPSLSLADNIVRPLAITVIGIFTFVILFLILGVAIQLIGSTLDLVSKLPLLNTANKLLGGCMGIVSASICVVILCIIAQFLITLQVSFADTLVSLTSTSQVYQIITNIDFMKLFGLTGKGLL